MADQEFDQYLKGAIQEVLAAEKGTGNPAAPEPIKLKVAGQDLTYGSLQELEAGLNQFVGATATQLAQLQQQQASPAKEGAAVTGAEAPTWSNEAFIDKMTKDPQDALGYAFNQLLLDGKSENPLEDIKQQFKDMDLTKRAIAAYQFKEAHPEFTGGQDAANRIEQIRQKMNLPYDFQSLEASYLMGINKGLLPNYPLEAQHRAWQAQQVQGLQQQDQQFQAQPFQNPNAQFNPYQAAQPQFPQQTQNPYLQAPPGVPRNTGNFNPSFDPEDLSIEQIEQVLRKTGQFAGR